MPVLEPTLKAAGKTFELNPINGIMVTKFGDKEYLPGKCSIYVAFIALACFSFFVHFRGAYAEETYFWNVHPENVDRVPSRIWDWDDLQFLR